MQGERILVEQLEKFTTVIVEGLNRLVLQSEPSVLTGLTDVLSAITAFKGFNTVAGRSFPFLPALARLEIALTVPDQKTGDHYLTECTQFNLTENYSSLDCGHTFHTDCIRTYLDEEWTSMTGTKAGGQLLCPVDSALISEAVLSSINPTVSSLLSSRRSIPAVYASSLLCSRCHLPAAASIATFCHQGCVLCLSCVGGGQHCSVCGASLRGK